MSFALAFGLLGSLVLATGTTAAHPPSALITPSPVLQDQNPTKTLAQRGVISGLTADVNSILSGLGSSIPSYVASGVPNFFQDFPTGDKVKNSLGLNDSQIQALPTQVLNIPPYGNWTERGWNVRFHGNVYKQPNISQSKVDDLANGFLIGTSVQELPPDQAAQARNLTREIYVLQQENQNVTFNLVPAPSAGASGEQGGGGATTPSGGNQQIRFPNPTTAEGDFDGFVPIKSDGLQAGNSTSNIQRLNVFTQGDINGNATAYLVPASGLTIVSDIDDILRVTKIYQPKEGLLNSFARPFTAWMNMPYFYTNWSMSIPGVHFHYLTTTPEQITRNYMDFIYKTYPGGSFDTRPLNFSDVSATLSIRKFLLQKLFDTFPQRRFVLVGDVSNSDIMRDYPQMAKDNPGRVCILLRNTTATDDDRFPYDTSGFEGLDPTTYMFFVVPDDLTHIDIASTHCLNSSIKQNLTFSTQNLPFGASKKHSGGATLTTSLSVAVATAFAACLLLLGS